MVGGSEKDPKDSEGVIPDRFGFNGNSRQAIPSNIFNRDKFIKLIKCHDDNIDYRGPDVQITYFDR